MLTSINVYELDVKGANGVASRLLPLDEFRDQKWRDLVAMQEQQITFLERLIERQSKSGD